MAEKTTRRITSVKEIEQAIHVIRGQRVMLDSDLAALYGVPTHRLNEQVVRNKGRFPEDFAYQLTRQEFTTLSRKLRYQKLTAVAGESRPGSSPSKASPCFQRTKIVNGRSREHRDYARVRPHAAVNGNAR